MSGQKKNLTLLSKQLKEEIVGLKSVGGGWYQLERLKDPNSTRYIVGMFEKVDGFKFTLFDHKGGSSTQLDIGLEMFDEKLSNENKKPEFGGRHEKVHKAIKKGVSGDNGYLKNKKILSLIPKETSWKVLDDSLIIPYTNFEIYPDFCGAKIVKKDGFKKCAKGSRMKGSFHFHRKTKSDVYILGEGMAECIVARAMLERYNILEVGGCGNMRAVIDSLPKTAIVYIMAENDSVEFYEKLSVEYPQIKINYPPSGKDFADYYPESKDAQELRSAILGEDFKNSKYKALGCAGTTPVVYSNDLKQIISLNLNNLDEVIRFCHATSGFEEWKKQEKLMIVNRVFEECLQHGNYDPDRNYGVGLWKKKKNYYYNDGRDLYSVKEGVVSKVEFSDIISNDFILFRQQSPALRLNDDESYLPYVKEMLSHVDFEEECYHKIFLGFLVASVFAGSLEFRPHIWFQSNIPHAGKSWLSNWATKALIPQARGVEGSGSRVAGARQTIQNFGGLHFCDEFAEKGTANPQAIKERIEMFRSGSTSDIPYTLGQPSQVPIKQYLKFMALIACIDGFEFLKRQDYERIIMMNLKNKGNVDFKTEWVSKFNDFKDSEQGWNFSYLALKKFHLFDAKYHEYYIKLEKKGLDIGHRSRGLATCMSAYEIMFGDDSELFDQICSSRLVEPFKEETDGDNKSPILVDLLNLVVDRNDFGGVKNTPLRSILDGSDVESTALISYGLFSANGYFYVNPTNFGSFISKYQKNMTKDAILKRLKNTPEYQGRTSVTVESTYHKNVLKFDLGFDAKEV